jgi:hypothetical protein
MRLRQRLPGHHLGDDSRHLIEICLGIVGTMAGLVLGLLVGSATASYNAQRDELLDVSGKVVLLDRLLAHYGPPAAPARATLQAMVAQALVRIWPDAQSSTPQMDPLKMHGELFLDQLESLEPSNDRERSLKPAAIALALNVGQTRWLMYAQTGQTISSPLVILLVFWFTITFVGFGIFSPPNATVMAALGLCALAVSGAIFLTMEMYTPFQGIVQLSSAPLRDALAHLGR